MRSSSWPIGYTQLRSSHNAASRIGQYSLPERHAAERRVLVGTRDGSTIVVQFATGQEQPGACDLQDIHVVLGPGQRRERLRQLHHP